MDLVADMLLQCLESEHSDMVKAQCLRPPMRRRLTSVNSIGDGDIYGMRRAVSRLNKIIARNFLLNVSAFNGDRLLNRFWDYPRWLRRQVDQFDLFHVVDHSYAHLVHQLPPGRTIVTCHDLDAFRSLLDPGSAWRSMPRNALARHILAGMRKAALVVCDSAAIRNELLEHKLLPPERVVTVPIGVHPTCRPESEPVADAKASSLLGPASSSRLDILHVGSTIPRKGLEVLLRVFSEVRKKFPQARLIRVGGPFTPAQIVLTEQLNLNGSVLVAPFLDRAVLSAVYRRATLVLQPSEREGFGLPVVEALACGTPVIASDLAVLREVGGNAIVYCAVGDVSAWVESVNKLLHERQKLPEQWARRRAEGVEQAAKFSWSEYSRKMVSLYQQVLECN